jgi:hypothetical protein
VQRVHDELRRQFGRIHPYAMDSALGVE